MTMKKSHFSLRLRAARLSRGWRQWDLAVAMNTDAASVCAHEAGTRSPGLDTAIKYAAALGMTLGQLLGEPCTCRQVAPVPQVRGGDT